MRSRRHRSGSRARRYQRGRRLESACAKTLASARGLCFYAPDVRRSHDGGLVSGLDPSLLRSRRPALPARPLRLPTRGPLFQKPYQAATVVKDRQWQSLTGRKTYSRPTYAGRSSARPPAGVGAPTTWRRSSFPCTSLGALGPRIGSANGDGVHPRLRGRDREDGHRDRIPGHASVGARRQEWQQQVGSSTLRRPWRATMRSSHRSGGEARSR